MLTCPCFDLIVIDQPNCSQSRSTSSDENDRVLAPRLDSSETVLKFRLVPARLDEISEAGRCAIGVTSELQPSNEYGSQCCQIVAATCLHVMKEVLGTDYDNMDRASAICE
jgi:hypothetical protein